MLGQRIPCDEVQGHRLSPPVVACPLAHVGILGGLDGEELRRGLVLPGRVRKRKARGLLSNARNRCIADERGCGSGKEGCVERVEEKGVC